MKKSFVVSTSLICIFTLSFLVYAAVNTTLTLLLKTTFPFIILLVTSHILAMLWSCVIMANKKRRIETRIRWSAFVCLVPFFGIVSYILFGRPYKYKKNKLYKYKNKKTTDFKEIQESLNIITELKKDTPEFYRAFLTGFIQQNQKVYKNFELDFFDNGNKYYENLLLELNNAQKYILINMYLINESEILDRISEILINKVKQGVKIYVIYDWLGCYNQFRKTKKKWKSVNIQMLGYSPVHFPFIVWKANYRNHRKDIVIDGKVGFVGGINISDDYCNISSKYGYWNDSAYRIKKEAVKELENIFIRDWNFYKKKKLESISLSSIKNKELEKINDDFLQVVASGPNHPTPIHLDILLSLINSAQKSIWIKTPYFIPPPELVDALCLAANSGLDVRMIIPGMSDQGMLLDVTISRTKKLFDNKVKIFSMNHTFVHEKTYLFDDSISFVGTTNLDYRALFSDQQTMLLIKSEKVNKQIKDKIEHDFKISHQYNKTPIKQKSIFRRIVIRIYNTISPIL